MYIYPGFPQNAVGEYLQPTSIWNSLIIRLCDVMFLLFSVIVFALV